MSAVGAATVTVTTSGRATVYAVTGDTQIVRNGAQVTLSQLRVGDAVELHVLPSTTGGHEQLERIFAGTLPPRGGRGDGDGPDVPVA